MDRPAELPLPPGMPPSWRADLGRRMCHRALLKFIGVSAFMWLFFLAYFHTLKHPAFAVTQMPLTALDHLIPFQPLALLAYVSLWLYVGIVPGLLLRLRDLVVYGLWAGALCVTGLACFYFWPTAVPARTADISGLAGFAMLRGVDAAGNACPSLHVASAVFTAAWINRLMRMIQAPPALRWANLAWVLSITWSTVAIRQHVVLDAMAGAALGAAFAALAIRCNGGVGAGAAR